MTEKHTDEFRKLADQFIHLANEQYQQSRDGRVGYALMYAAARFNAFIVAVTAGHQSELAEEKEAATAYFADQYRQMFAENIEDYAKNFNQYL